jgi:hypothetical protein
MYAAPPNGADSATINPAALNTGTSFVRILPVLWMRAARRRVGYGCRVVVVVVVGAAMRERARARASPSATCPLLGAVNTESSSSSCYHTARFHLIIDA